MCTKRFKTFGDGLRFHREKQKLTHADLAQLVGYSPKQIRQLEENTLIPNLQDVYTKFFPTLRIERASDAGLEMEVQTEQSQKRIDDAQSQHRVISSAALPTAPSVLSRPSHCMFMRMFGQVTDDNISVKAAACTMHTEPTHLFYILREKLSVRLFEALKLKAEGLTEKQISEEMHITQDAVVKYFSRIRKQLGVPTTEQAVDMFNLSVGRQKPFPF